MANENKIEEILRSSLENMRSMVDANTVIGTPYVTPGGVTIIPVSKVSVGFASGGVDYFGKQNNPKSTDTQNFGGGGGSGLSVSPVGFLVIGTDGHVEMINVGVPSPSDPLEQIAGVIERSPEILNGIKQVFTKKSDAEKAMDD